MRVAIPVRHRCAVCWYQRSTEHAECDSGSGDQWSEYRLSGMIVVVGYAMVINMMRAGYLMPFFYLGFVTAAFTNFNLVALGVIGTVMAVLYIQLSPKYNRVARCACSGSW